MDVQDLRTCIRNIELNFDILAAPNKDDLLSYIPICSGPSISLPKSTFAFNSSTM